MKDRVPEQRSVRHGKTSLSVNHLFASFIGFPEYSKSPEPSNSVLGLQGFCRDTARPGRFLILVS